MTTKAKVIKDWQPIYPEPLVLKMGEVVVVEDRPSEWAGWVWCTAANGKTGWVPLAYLDRTGDSARATRDYTTAELAAQVGDELNLLVSESGWYWAIDAQGRTGWIPAESVQA